MGSGWGDFRSRHVEKELKITKSNVLCVFFGKERLLKKKKKKKSGILELYKSKFLRSGRYSNSSTSEPKKHTLPFISVQRTLYPVLHPTAYKYRKRLSFHN